MLKNKIEEKGYRDYYKREGVKTDEHTKADVSSIQTKRDRCVAKATKIQRMKYSEFKINHLTPVFYENVLLYTDRADLLFMMNYNDPCLALPQTKIIIIIHVIVLYTYLHKAVEVKKANLVFLFKILTRHGQH